MATAINPSRPERKHPPLADDLASVGHLRTKSSKRKSRSGEEDQDHYVDAQASKKILMISQDLADEEAAEEKADAAARAPNPAFNFNSRLGVEVESEDERQQYEDDGEWGSDEEVEQEEVDPTDLAILNKFVPAGSSDPIFDTDSANGPEAEGINLADLILQKIAEKEAAEGGRIVHGGGAPEDAVEIPAKVVDVFTKCGQILSRYKSGPLPKPFKVLPTFPQWEDLLAITRPDQWTPNACYEAMKIFVSPNARIARRFLEYVLLDRVRDDIRETKKLNVHLYKALKKALFRPDAFNKGFLFPLIESGTCTLREAHIISSLITRVSIPPLHAAVALLRICEIAAEQSSVSTESAGAANMFIRVLLQKKYALPYKAIDALVFHFLRFRASNPVGGDQEMSGTKGKSAVNDLRLPVLWHQSLLAFAQRYKDDITEDQREALLDLLLVRGHKDIGPEVRRELLAGRGRGVVPIDAGKLDDGDDTMVVDS